MIVGQHHIALDVAPSHTQEIETMNKSQHVVWAKNSKIVQGKYTALGESKGGENGFKVDRKARDDKEDRQ